ncbi:MAG: 2-oxoacid:acceptor oxidoreductase family protein [FCB group bacterium]|jgi:pyruvate-ferredoxin/flavodoxin oxidoreductase|nr:2-oxoacid:acceptor oxidoreductase family protein [FCB group bacterium]
MKEDSNKQFKYPGKREAMDGNTAVIMCEREASDAAGAYPITPSTQMGEYWAEAAAAGHINVSGRPLIFIEPEGEHAAAGVTAGLAMTGLRSCNFSSGQGIVYMHESLYGAVGKRLTYILNMGCRAITKSTLNVHAGHDDYHAIDDTGFFQVFGKNVQEACDLNIIAHKVAELALNPGIVAQDGFLTTHLIESLLLPERELIEEYLGHPEDIIDTPTAAQRMIYGPQRRRIPEIWTVDNPVMAGVVQNQDSYMQSVAAQRPYFFDHIAELTDQCMEEFYQLTGRRYRRVSTYRCEDAEYIILGQGSVVVNAEAIVDYLRETRGVKVGVVNLTMYRPFPGDMLSELLKGRKGVVVLERTDQPLAEDLPLVREIRTVMTKCVENARAVNGELPHPKYAVYSKPEDMPALYNGCFGMGSRDLQPEGLLAAVENMLPGGKQKKLFYLSIDFVREKAFTPQQEIHMQTILDGYPHVKDLGLRGSENPNLMPKDSITVRLHSIGGWGAITTGKNLAMTLFDLLGYHIKANPKYGSEKKGQPTTYYLSAAPEPIRINCEYFYVDVVLSPDPNVFKHSNPLAGLKKGGFFIIQSDLDTPDEVWRSIPPRFQKIIVDNEIRVFYLDAFKVARDEASDPELQFRMQGIAFQGAFFAASPVMEKNNLTEETLFAAIESQLQDKFGKKGARVVEDNLRVVRRGFSEVKEITNKAVIADAAPVVRKDAGLPLMLKHQPQSEAASTDIHRFWEQTGAFYASGQGNDNLTDPFIGLSFIPVGTGIFRDMTGIRFTHPTWDPAKCTGCGNCWTICPDSALPGLVNTVSDVLDTAVKQLEERGHSVKHVAKAVKVMEPKLRAFFDGAEVAPASEFVARAAQETLAESGSEHGELEQEMKLLVAELNDFKFALTKPFYSNLEKEAKGKGGLLSITVDPYTCKGCMECVNVCPENAFASMTQTQDSIDTLRKNWEFWLTLPNTKEEFVRIDSLEEGVGALETLLLDKNNYKAMVGGDGACLGCAEKTVLHLFTATIEALMQPRVKKHVAYIDDLITQIEKHIRLKLAESMNVSDTDSVQKAMAAVRGQEMTLSNLTAAMDKASISQPIDADWLKRTTQLLARLKQLKWQYTQGTTGKGRANLGIANSTGCSSVWASTYPFNPYPFPWTNHLFQDSPSVAMGLFEGHMAKMADGFKAIRMAELELEGKYDAAKHDEYFRYFNWMKFTDEEWHLSPPVVVVGGDGALYDIGFQNLSRMMMSGKPIKVVALDTQVYSNTGGQACTSGFIGQVSDMAQYGKAMKGKYEIRKEIGLIAMAHRTTYVLQGSTANTSHLIEGFIEGLMIKRPAIFNIYCPCMPEHGIADDLSKHQSRLALESRAYPSYKFNPDNGKTWAECLNLDGNPAPDAKWPTYTLNYVNEEGHPATLEMPLTFADFAVTEARFRKHFKKAPRDTWNENMVHLAEYLERGSDEREGKFPFVWAVDGKNQLARLLVSSEIVKSCEERQDFWMLLQSMAAVEKVDVEQITAQVRQDVVGKLAQGLLELTMRGADLATTIVAQPTAALPEPAASVTATPAPAAAPAAKPATPAPAATNGHTPVTLDSNECTACGECVQVNPKIFAWNDKKQAVVKDPKAGPFKDIVKAAEKCAARAIKPGTPADKSEKDVEKLIKRAQKYN